MWKLFLLIDDDNDDAELFGEALSKIDPPPVAFSHIDSGKDIVQFLENSKKEVPDLIFMDINMPEVSGWHCLHQLKNHTEFKDIPVVMYSTSSNPEDKGKAVASGALGLLPKPANFKLLIKTLNNIARTEKEMLLNHFEIALYN